MSCILNMKQSELTLYYILRILCSPASDICVVPRVEMVYVSSEPVKFCVMFVIPSSWSNFYC